MHWTPGGWNGLLTEQELPVLDIITYSPLTVIAEACRLEQDVVAKHLHLVSSGGLDKYQPTPGFSDVRARRLVNSP